MNVKEIVRVVLDRKKLAKGPKQGDRYFGHGMLAVSGLNEGIGNRYICFEKTCCIEWKAFSSDIAALQHRPHAF